MKSTTKTEATARAGQNSAQDETAHTAGPWTLAEVGSEYPKPHLVYVAVKQGAEMIAFAGAYIREPKSGESRGRIAESEARANARLIAAAPELLQALSFYVFVHETTKEGASLHVAADEKARAALAKATGGRL